MQEWTILRVYGSFFNKVKSMIGVGSNSCITKIMCSNSDESMSQGHESFCTNAVENSGLEMDYIIPIEVISLEIFRNLSLKDLLTCSLVSKQWNSVARKVLYENKKCTASLILEEEKEKPNIKIIDYLQTTDQRLFNHLVIKMSFGNDHDCEQGCQKLLEKVESAPLQHANFRHLSLYISFSHEEDCCAFQVVKTLCRMIISEKVDHLTLCIKSFRNQVESCSAFRDKNDKFLFTNLKCIEIFVNTLNRHEVLEVFFRHSPQLQEIRGKMEVSDLPFLLSQNRSYLVKTLDLTQARFSDLDTVLKFAKSQPRLKSVSFDDNYLQAGSKYIWGEIFSLICEYSKNSLEDMLITPPMLNILSQSHWPGVYERSIARVFPNVQVFTFEGTHNYDLTTLFRTLWTVWDEMETIRLSATPTEIVALEPTLIGIFTEEWDHWREIKNNEGIDLKKMQYAPIRPSLRNCSNLQHFLVHLNSDVSYKWFTQGLIDISNEIHPKVVKLAYTGANGSIF
ncbi:unnamed protein product [Allacma fusca]|uniref:F-box domain-containing protein n=1 Tax=Allacma fusca TaxID=39272 RepID=A0A8J2JPB6_9HEXA|nr:unnamed protein product [Allacma fusca]